MLNGRHAHIAFTQNGATLCVNYVLSDCLDCRHTVEVDALYFIASVLRGRVECHGETQTGVQAFAAQRETAFKCLLF